MAINKIGNKAIDSTLVTGNTTVTAASDDAILISDTSDSGNLKKALISTITDTMIANGGNNRILTDTATAGSINGEANLTFDGSTLALTGDQTVSGTITAAGFTIGSAAITETELEILDGATLSTTELNVLDGIPGTLTATELGYVDGVTSAIQTQLNTKAPLASPALTGTATAVNLTLSGNLTINGTTTTVSSTNTTVTDNIIELNSGAGSNANDSGILIERGSTGDNAFMGFDESSDTFVLGTTTATADATGNLSVTPSKITVGGIVIGSADINETELEILDGATLSTTELNYVDGVTSAIQTQIDSKLATAGGTMTGDLTVTGTFVHKVGSTDVGRITSSSNNIKFQNLINDADIRFEGKDGSSDITALHLDMSEGGAAIFSGNVTATTFSGSGASLTNLNGSNISSGSVADARIPALTASKLTGALPAIDGSALTGIETVPSSSTAVGSIMPFMLKKSSGSGSSGSLTLSAGTEVTPSTYTSGIFLISDYDNSLSKVEKASPNYAMGNTKGYMGISQQTSGSSTSKTGVWRVIDPLLAGSATGGSGQNAYTYYYSVMGLMQRIS